jgi:O-antigen ligase
VIFLCTVRGEDLVHDLQPRLLRGITIRRVAVFGLHLGVFLTVFPILRLSSVFFTVSDMLFVLCSIPLLFQGRLTVSRKLSGPATLWCVGVFAVILGLGVSSLVRGDPVRGLVVILQYTFAFFLLPLVLVTITKEESIAAGRSFLLAMVIVSLAGVVMYYFFPDVGRQYMIGGRMGSYLENPNNLAKMISMTIPLALSHWLRTKTAKSLLIAAFVILFNGLLVASSFSGLLTSVVGLLLFLFLLLDLKRVVQFFLVALAVGCAVYFSNVETPTIFISRVIPALQGGLSSAGSMSDKIYLVQEAWELLKVSPFIGLGADGFEKVSSFGTPVHNTYMLLWVEGGLLSIIGWLLVLLAPVVLGLREWLRRDTRVEGTTLLVVIAVFAANCLTNTHVYARFWVLPLFLAVSVIVAKSER